MRSHSLSLLLLALLSPIVPAQTINGKCGLKWFELNLTPESTIMCRGDSRIPRNRYWAIQTPPLEKAEIVVMPGNTQDVAETIKVIANKAPAWYDWSFVSGGHSNVNGSSASGLVIDLQRLDSIQVLKNFKLPDNSGKSEPGVISYGPGATWGQIDAVTAGSGWVAVGARVSSVGAGGFTTGGGIGFLGGAYGYAIDRIIQMEVVLLDGLVVIVTPKGAYSDLFWALQGGNGQFAIVTRFWVRAVPEPTKAEVGYYWIQPSEIPKARENVVDFFNDNGDPHSLVYWVRGFVPPSLVETDPSKLGVHEVIVTLRFGDPKNPQQPSYESTFSRLLGGLNPSFGTVLTMPYEQASEGVSAFFPESFRRLFQGPVVSTISKPYLDKLATRMDQYINESLAKGDPPASAIYALQYMYPGLNGNLPKSDAATAWPHSSASGHQTLFSPAWSNPANDLFVKTAGADLNKISYDYQRATGKFPRDYPNYWSAKDPSSQESSKNSGWNGSRYFGSNLPRLVQIKDKYDPECLIRKGPTFASAACKRMRYASIF